MGTVATLAPRTGIVMGPTPRIHLGICSLVVPIAPAPCRQTVVSPISPLLPEVAILYDAKKTVRPEVAEWKPVDPQTARAALRVERAVEIPRGRQRTRTPRLPQLSTGDASERMRRLASMDRRRRVVMVAASILVVVGLLTGIWRFTDVGYAAQPGTSWNQVTAPHPVTATPAASQTPSVSATPSAAPSTAETTTPAAPVTTAQPPPATQGAGVPAILRANPIYSQAIDGSCPEQAKPTKANDAMAAMTAYVDCMNTVWGSIVESTTFRFKPASIYFYINTIVTSCTTLHTTDPVSAMYCPLDATIYVSPNGVASAVGNRFYGAELVTHEYAHHVQSLTQILAKAHEQGWSENKYSRRVQLQAHCMAFAVLNHVDGFAPDPALFRIGWQVGPGSATYGSVASLQYWGEKGLQATTVGACETFSVPSAAVA